jgi:hypothetical protein
MVIDRPVVGIVDGGSKLLHVRRLICGRRAPQIAATPDFATLQTWAQTEQRTERASAERAVTTGLLEPHLSQGGIVIRFMRRSGPV